MIQIAYVVEEQLPCEPGAELCGACDVRINHAVCERFGELVNHRDDSWELDRRCPACLRAERRAVLRARFVEQKEQK